MVDWKKEIKLSDLVGRKPPPKQAEPETPVTPKATPEKQSIWKKEISLGRKPKPAVEAAAEAAPPVVEPEPVVESEPAAEPLASEPEPTTTTYEWLTASFDADSLPAGEAPPLPATPPAQDDPPDAEPAPVPEPAAFEPSPPAEPVAAAPEPAPAPAPVEIPVAPEPSTAPEPAAAPELAAEPAKRSALKKEISFRRRSKQPAEESPLEKAPAAEQTERTRTKGRAPAGKKLVGLKIGASQLAAARVVNNGTAELLQLAREPLAEGIVAAGEVRDPDALAAALRDFFAKHKLPKRGVRLGVSNNRIGVRTFEIGGIDDAKQLGNAIRFRAQEALPIPIEEAVLDYQILGEGVDEEGKPTKRILLVVAYREQVDRYVAACRKAGITLAGIDLEGFALLRSLAAPRAADTPAEAALVAVSVGHDRTTLAVSDGRVCEFTRVLDWGGFALNLAIARALDLSPVETAPIKHDLSLEHGVPDGLTDEQATLVRDAARRQVHTFARELVSSLQFYQSQPGSLGIGEIVLTGGSAHLPGLAGELERLVGVAVRVGDPLARVRVNKRVSEPDQLGSLAIAIGLGIED